MQVVRTFYAITDNVLVTGIHCVINILCEAYLLQKINSTSHLIQFMSIFGIKIYISTVLGDRNLNRSRECASRSSATSSNGISIGG